MRILATNRRGKDMLTSQSQPEQSSRTLVSGVFSNTSRVMYAVFSR